MPALQCLPSIVPQSIIAPTLFGLLVPLASACGTEYEPTANTTSSVCSLTHPVCTQSGHSFANPCDADAAGETVAFSGYCADFDRNGCVNFADFVKLSGNFGKAGHIPRSAGDTDGDEDIDFADFLQLSGETGLGSCRESCAAGGPFACGDGQVYANQCLADADYTTTQPLNTCFGRENCIRLVERHGRGAWAGEFASCVVYEELIRAKFKLPTQAIAGHSRAQRQAYLQQLIDDVNALFAKRTIRRLNFNPALDIDFYGLTPYNPFDGHHPPPGPFEFWIHGSPQVGTRAFFLSNSNPPAAGAYNVPFAKIYNPDDPTAQREYWMQVYAIAHEFAHVFLAGQPEYYHFEHVDDLTGVAPLASTNVDDPNDAFFSAHTDWLADPMLRNIWNEPSLGMPVARQDLIDTTQFADASVAMINGSLTFLDADRSGSLPDVAHTRVTVYDASGIPVVGARVRVWNDTRRVWSGTPRPPGLLVDLQTDAWGHIVFNWAADASSINDSIFVKVHAPGYLPQARLITMPDMQKRKLYDGFDDAEIRFTLEDANP